MTCIYNISNTTRLAAAGALVLASFYAHSISLTGQTVNVIFSEPGFADVIDNDVLAIDPGIEISFLDASNVGNTIMLDGESIEFTDSGIIFTLRGDGPDHAAATPDNIIQTTGFNAGASYILSGFDFSIDSVTLASLDNVIGVGIGSEILYDSNSITFDISTLGIGEIQGGLDLGTIALNVQFIPVPAALPLMITGLAGLGLFGYRKPQS